MGKGILYGVGTGPGDPGLLTVKGVHLIRSCDFLAVPDKDKEQCFAYRIAVNAVPDIKEKPVLAIDMPMTRDQDARKAAYKAGADSLAEILSEGKNIVFLTLGDPSVYSTFAYLAPLVRNLGFEVHWVPGVTSFCAASASLGQPLCTGDEALHVFPGRQEESDALCLSGTKVFMKGGHKLMLMAFREMGLDVKAVENCGLENEHRYENVDAIPEDAGYYLVTIAKEKKG